MNPVLNHVSRAVIALMLSALFFFVLPLVQMIFGGFDEQSERQNTVRAPLLEMHIRKKEEPRKQQQRMRSVQSSASKGRIRSFDIKFTPDLAVGGGTMAFADETNLENMVFEEGETEEPAVPLSRMSIPYPPRAREAGIEGTLEIVILVDRKGSVAGLDFVRLPHAMFRRPVQEVVMKWKFRPAKHKGVPVQLRMRQVVEFKLEN